MICDTCGKDLGDHIYSDHPTAHTHSWASKQCRECYIKSGHPECKNEKCDTLLMPNWKYCSECGTKQTEGGQG